MNELWNYEHALDELCYVKCELGELGDMIELWNFEHELGEFSIIQKVELVR